MRSLPRFLLIVALCGALFPGCALLRKFKRKRLPPAAAMVKVARPTQLIGTIVLVNTEGAFVLVDGGSRPNPTVGTPAESRSMDGTASAQLKVTEIRKRPFVIADIVSGTPVKGDEVFQ